MNTKYTNTKSEKNNSPVSTEQLEATVVPETQ